MSKDTAEEGLPRSSNPNTSLGSNTNNTNSTPATSVTTLNSNSTNKNTLANLRKPSISNLNSRFQISSLNDSKDSPPSTTNTTTETNALTNRSDSNLKFDDHHQQQQQQLHQSQQPQQLQQNSNQLAVNNSSTLNNPSTVTSIASNLDQAANKNTSASRTEFFAARLHDAIKGDHEVSDSEETFVYETKKIVNTQQDSQQQQQIPQQQEQQSLSQSLSKSDSQSQPQQQQLQQQSQESYQLQQSLQKLQQQQQEKELIAESQGSINSRPQSISVSKAPTPHYQNQSQVHSPVSLSTFPINKEKNRIIKNATSIQSLKSSINNTNNNNKDKLNINLKDNNDVNKSTHDDLPQPPLSANSAITTPDLDKTIILNFPHKSNNNDTKNNIKSAVGPMSKITTNTNNDQTNNNSNSNEITTANNNVASNSNVGTGALSADKYSPFINNNNINNNTLNINKLNKNKNNNISENTSSMGSISGSRITSAATVSESPTHTQYPSSAHLDASSSIGTNSVSNSSTNFLPNQNQHNNNIINNNNNNMDNSSNFNNTHVSTRKSSDAYSFRSVSDTIVQSHSKFGSTSSQDNTNLLSNSGMTAVSNSNNSSSMTNNSIDTHNNHTNTNTNTNSNNSTSTINNTVIGEHNSVYTPSTIKSKDALNNNSTINNHDDTEFTVGADTRSISSRSKSSNPYSKFRRASIKVNNGSGIVSTAISVDSNTTGDNLSNIMNPNIHSQHQQQQQQQQKISTPYDFSMTATTNSPVASHHQIDTSPYNTVNSNIALPQNNFLHNGNLNNPNLNLNNLGANHNNTSNTNTTTFTNNSIMNNSTTSVQNSNILPNQQHIPSQQQSIHLQPSIQQLQNQSRNDTSDESACVSNQLRQEAPNQLRQITSRIFDSKGTAPRRYSGVDEGTDYLDDFDIDDEEFLGDMHQQLLPNMRYVNGNNNTNNLNTPNDHHHNNNHGNHSGNDHYNQYNFMNNHPLRHMSSFANYDSVADCYTPIQRQQQKYYNSLDNHDVDDLQEYSINSGYISNFDDVNNGINGFSPLLHNGINNNANNLLANKIMRKRRQDLYFSPHNFRSTRSKRIQQVKNFCYTAGFVIILLFLVFLSFMSGFLLATTKELQGTKVDKIFDIIISQEELVFNLEIEAFNPGLFSISIVDVELDVFAKTKFVDPSLWYSDPSCSYDMKTIGDLSRDNSIDNSIELEEEKLLSISELGSGTTKPFYTVMLGSVSQLDIPLHFHGGFFTRQKSSGVTEIKIKDPCRTNHGDDDDDGGNDGNGGEGDGEDDDAIHVFGNNYHAEHLNKHVQVSSSCDISDIPDKQWLDISRHPFELIVRGLLKYNLQFSSTNQTVGINASIQVNAKDPGAKKTIGDVYYS